MSVITFKKFLIEGGKATEQYGISRASKDDIDAAIVAVAKALGAPEEDFRNDVLGSTRVTLMGKKKDSGDIDIALSLDKYDPDEVDAKMKSVFNGEGAFNRGTKVGSYAVPVNGKKVQVDLMFVKNKEWAKFAYYSSQGDSSKYPGSVRNALIIQALIHKDPEPGKDFRLRNSDDEIIARASRSFKLDTGIERLFKMARKNKNTGKFNKGLESVTPEELDAFLRSLGKKVHFSKDAEIIDGPDEVAEFVFGPGVKAADIMTAEDIISIIKKMPNAEEILTATKEHLTKNKLEVPTEI